MTPRSEAIAFRIWAYATPLGWDCTVNEIAEELGVHVNQVKEICRVKGWRSRLRFGPSDYEYMVCSYGWLPSESRTRKHEALRDLGLSHA